MKRKILIVLLSACMLFTCLTGCGGAQNGSQASTAGGSQASAAGGSQTSTAGGKTGTASGPVTFVYARPTNINTWDIQNMGNTLTTTLTKLYYNTLITYETPGEFLPELATEWSVSDDGLRYTFKLRDGVKFHNGEAFDSASVKTTLMRLVERTELLQSSAWKGLDHVETPDANTAILVLKQPWGAILTTLADVPMLPPKMYEEKGDAMFDFNETNKPVGTGAWICDKWMPGQDAEFVRNDEYWNWGDRKSNVDRFIYRPVLEDTTRVSGIITGDFDMVDSLPIEEVTKLNGSQGVKADILETSGITMAAFACNRGPFQDKNARLAVSHAINRQLLVDSIVGSGIPASWPVAKGCLGFNYDSPVPEYSLELAKEYLAKSNYNGEPFKLLLSSGVFPRSKEVGQAVVAMMVEAGFNVELEIVENAAFTERRLKSEYDIYIASGATPGGDPDSFIVQRWMNDIHKSGYVNEKLNAAIRAQGVELDPVKREALMKDALAISWEEVAPHLAIYQSSMLIAYRDNISGIQTRVDAIFDLSRIMKG